MTSRGTRLVSSSLMQRKSFMMERGCFNCMLTPDSRTSLLPTLQPCSCSNTGVNLSSFQLGRLGTEIFAQDQISSLTSVGRSSRPQPGRGRSILIGQAEDTSSSRTKAASLLSYLASSASRYVPDPCIEMMLIDGLILRKLETSSSKSVFQAATGR